MTSQKKPLAFLLGITENLGFAAGNVALSLYKYMRDEVYEIVVYYTSLYPEDMAALEQIPNVRLVQFGFPESFVTTMLKRLPPESRFRDLNHLMCFCHFEVFALLAEYRTVAWLDADVSVQANLKSIADFRPFGITLDTPWPVQNNFTRPIDGYQMAVPGCCTAVLVVGDDLPYERLHGWCYEKAIELADTLVNPDQAIINIAFQEFDVAPNVMPLEQWQCISWKDEAIAASIVHFGTGKKVWNDTNICSAFPEWYRMHLEWLKLGGSDFDRHDVHPRNALPSLNDLDGTKDKLREIEQARATAEENVADSPESEQVQSVAEEHERIDNVSSNSNDNRERGTVLGLAKNMYLRLGIHTAPAGTLGFALHRPVHWLTRSRQTPPIIVGAPERSRLEYAPDLPDLPPVAFRVTGGIGDHLIAARYIRDLLAVVGDFRFDIYSSRVEVAEWVFARFPQANAFYNEFLEWSPNVEHYALALWVQQFVVMHQDTAKWRVVLGNYKKFGKICEHIARSRSQIDHRVRHHPRSDNYLAQEALLRGANRFNIAHQMSGIRYGGDLLPVDVNPAVLARHDLARKSYLTVHNGADDSLWIGGTAFGGGRSTKTYPHFAGVIALIKTRFPALRIVQLGSSTSRPIPGVDVNLINKCTIQESGAVIANSCLHLDNESGLVHLAACLGVKSCVMFGPTSFEFFSYEGNINIPPSYCGNCWWLTENWMKDCARGYQLPKCLDDTPPETVFRRVLPDLEQLDPAILGAVRSDVQPAANLVA